MMEKNQAELSRLKADQEKDLLKRLNGSWRSSGPQSSSRRGLYDIDEDVKVQIKRGGDVAMNPFHNFHG